MAKTPAFMPYNDAVQQISRCILSGILLEASCDPSPGLVSPFSMGSHEDMNHYSFMLSTAAIASWIEACARLGCQADNPDELLPMLRPLGMEAEKAMLEATGGINTHKGMIFLGGITAAAAGLSMGERREAATIMEASGVCDRIARICRGIVHRELETPSINTNRKLTQGEYWYSKAGITGIRGEVERGLPSVQLTGLPVFDENLRQYSLKTAMAHTLLHLMTVVEDTTVLARAGLEGLELVKSAATQVIGLGGLHTERGRQALSRISTLFKSRRISPGGSADLLATTIALWMLEKGPIPAKKILPDFKE